MKYPFNINLAKIGSSKAIYFLIFDKPSEFAWKICNQIDRQLSKLEDEKKSLEEVTDRFATAVDVSSGFYVEGTGKHLGWKLGMFTPGRK